MAEAHRSDGDSLNRTANSQLPERRHALIQRLPFARILEGAAIGVALWCMVFVFGLLPGLLADTPGILIFAAAGIAGNVSRLRQALTLTLILAAALVVLVTQSSISNALASRWVREDQFAHQPVAAVVITSASVNPNTTMSGEALDHLLSGLELIRQGKGNVLATTTVEERFPTGLVSSEIDQARVIALFGGQILWLRTGPSESTRDEAIKSAALLLPRGMRRIAVVAAPMHTRRACSAFEAVGFSVTCVPARVRSPGGMAPGPWPRDRLTVFGDWVYEVIATGKYRMQGWLATKSPVPAP